jgi:hypothetical protein
MRSLDCRPRREGDRLVGAVIHDANSCGVLEEEVEEGSGTYYHFYLPFGFRSDQRVSFVHVGIEITHRNKVGSYYADTGDAEVATFDGDWYHTSRNMEDCDIGLRGVT